MKTKIQPMVILAPICVATGIALFIVSLVLFTEKLGISNLYEWLNFIPRFVILMVGIANVGTFVPIFIAGFVVLGRKGAIGQANKLRTRGMYKYVRNPMYAGVSFTLFGLGLILGSTAVVLSGLAWLTICYIQSKVEEKYLFIKFGEEYLQYKQKTPAFIPEFNILIKELFKGRSMVSS